MAQDAHIIDLRRSYIPIDPNAFPTTMHTTEAEDRPEQRTPVIPYDGYNFMPTPQGYCSFFGINSSLGINALAENVDDLFMIQTPQYQNILVALADTGIWTKDGSLAGAWNQQIVLAPPAAGSHLQWSKCVIDNVVYVYRQGEPNVWEANPANGYNFTAFVPSFLNMAGQLGIFKAGGRLGFWDSENSTSWSAFGDTHDLIPSPETMAGNAIFQDIVGRIVTVLQHGTGFVIYCTKSVVLVERNPNSAMLWTGRALFNNNGIAYREECCFAEPDSLHFAFTSQGLVEIGPNGETKFVAPEISTYLKEKRDPVYLKMMNGRYLFLPILDPAYLIGRVAFTSETVEAAVYSWKQASLEIANPTNQCRAILAAMRSFDQAYLFNTFGFTSYTQATAPAGVPIWRDNYSTTVSVADLKAWKDHDPIAIFGSKDYFLDFAFTNGGIPKIGGLGTEFMIPTKGPKLEAGFAAIIHQQANDKLFFHDQDWLWWSEERFFDHWKAAIDAKVHAPIIVGTVQYIDTWSVKLESDTTYQFGPYIMPTFFSEANRKYGIATKSAWLQRSLTRGINIEFVTRVVEEPIAEMPWHGGGFDYATYAATSSLAGDYRAFKDASDPGNAPHSVSTAEFPGNGVTNRMIRATATNGTGGPGGSIDVVPYKPAAGDITGSALRPLLVNRPVFQTQRVQTFRLPVFKYVDFATCVYKELGFTDISGHGHYTLLGDFVVDDAIAEAVDYVDVCTAAPKKGVPSFFNGIPVLQPWNNGSTCGRNYATNIGNEAYVYPAIPDVVIPSGTILLQAGSIEPIYPTYLGAFVYDVHYKKWGKMKQNYKQLLDYLPINNVAGDQVVPYDTFNPKVSALLENGSIVIFDQYPSDSELLFGKIGYYRKGFTDLEEVRLTNRAPYDGYLFVEASLDGRNIEASLGVIRAFTARNEVVEGFSMSARWYNVGVRGNYDLTHLEVRGLRTGRR